MCSEELLMTVRLGVSSVTSPVGGSTYGTTDSSGEHPQQLCLIQEGPSTVTGGHPRATKLAIDNPGN